MNRRINLIDFTGDGHFGSLTALASASELRCGCYSLKDKLLLKLKLHGLDAECCDLISPIAIGMENVGSCPGQAAKILLSSRCILSDKAIDVLAEPGRDEKYVTPDGRIVGYRVNDGIDPGNNFEASLRKAEALPETTLDAIRIDFPWHLNAHNGEEIANDLQLERQLDVDYQFDCHRDVFVRGSENVRVTGEVNVGAGAVIAAERYIVRLEKNTNIGAGAILSAKEGPIWLAEGSVIEPGAIIQGPAYIGPHSIVRAGARINGSVSLGPNCRVGGELSGVIMQGYSNKQHSGYLGGAVIGQWVNLGAATDNSDLKNNYRSVDVTLDGEKFDSGELHVGVFMGDFVRTAIQTRLNSGTVVGTCCNLFGNDFPQKAIPPFIWYGSEGYQEYRLDKAVETIRVVMDRRKKELSHDLEEALNRLFDQSHEHRREFLIGSLGGRASARL